MAGTIDVENDGEFLRHIVEDKRYPAMASFIKRAFDTVIPRKAIDFRTNVGRVIQQCLSMHGVPMFRTKYAGEPFRAGLPNGGAFALMICYGSHNGRLKGVWFKGVPPKDLDLLAAKKDGYMLMLRKYGQPVGAVIGGATTYTGQAIVSELIDVPTEFENSLKSIEAKLKDALADEEKAVPFYRGLLNDIENTRALNPKHTPPSQIERETDRYLFSMREGIVNIGDQEAKHKERITNMIKAIRELRRTLELERTRRGKPQVLRPLERV